MAHDLGKKLASETEETSLDEVLQTIRNQLHSPNSTIFNCPPFDTLLTSWSVRPAHSNNKIKNPQVIELASAAPGGGKTHLLYHFAALAALPLSHGGKGATCILLFDRDDALVPFSISRLVQQIAFLIPQNRQDLVEVALRHIHILRPDPTPEAMTATLAKLPTYFFAPDHPSRDRPVAFLALSSSSSTAIHVQAATAAAKGFACPTVLLLNHQNQQTFLGGRGSRRFICRRLPVRRFPEHISVIEAQDKAAERAAAVGEGRFECVDGEGGGGFGFWVRREGIGIGN